MNAHDSQRDLVAAYALGALDADESVQAQSHIDDCPDCANEFTEMRAVTGLIGFSAEMPVGMHADRIGRVKRNLMANIRGASTVQPPNAQSRVRPLPTVRGTARKRPASVRSWRFGPLTAPLVAAAFLIGLAAYAWNLNEQLHHTQVALQDVVAREKKTRTLALRDEEQLTTLLAPDAKRFDVDGGTVVKRGGRIFYVLTKLPMLTAGRVYQSWSVKSGTTVLTPGVTFKPDATGKAFVMLSDDAAQVSTVAVSVEPAGGSTQPTSKPLFVKRLS